MTQQKSPGSNNAGRIANIEFLLEEYGLPHYRWQAVLHLIRAGNKEGVSEMDDLEAAQNYLKRDIASLQKAKRSAAATSSRASRTRKPQPVSKANSAAAPSATSADEAQATA